MTENYTYRETQEDAHEGYLDLGLHNHPVNFPVDQGNDVILEAYQEERDAGTKYRDNPEGHRMLAEQYAKDIAAPYFKELQDHTLALARHAEEGRAQRAAFEEHAQPVMEKYGLEPRPEPTLEELAQRDDAEGRVARYALVGTRDWTREIRDYLAACGRIQETGQREVAQGLLQEDERRIAEGRGIMRGAAMSSREMEREDWPSALETMARSEREARESDSIQERAFHYTNMVRAAGWQMRYNSDHEHDDERRDHVLAGIMQQENHRQQQLNYEALIRHTGNLDAWSHPLYPAMNRLDNTQYTQRALDVLHLDSEGHAYRLRKVMESQQLLNESFRNLARTCEDEKPEIVTYAGEKLYSAHEIEEDIEAARDRIRQIENEETQHDFQRTANELEAAVLAEAAIMYEAHLERRGSSHSYFYLEQARRLEHLTREGKIRSVCENTDREIFRREQESTHRIIRE